MDVYRQRRVLLLIGFLLVLGIYVVRLLYLQVYDVSYKRLAANTALRKTIIYPARGLVYDRNGHLMLYNKAEFDLICVPREIKAFDTAGFCSQVNISADFVRKQLRRAWDESRFKPYTFLRGIGAESFATLQENLYLYPGFYTQVRTVRGYPHPSCAHIMGYIGEINAKQLEKKGGRYYHQGDYIGINGLEQVYEPILRGIRGTRYMIVDVHNREVGSFAAGLYDTLAAPGLNLHSGVDLDLEDYADSLMIGKAGGVVALDPATGEVIALVSTPGYDPNKLLGKDRGNNFVAYQQDPLKPMYNRAIMAPYPPGSTFKPLMALLGLSTGVIDPNQGWNCPGGYFVGPLHVKCHHHGPIGNVENAIQYSCNSYFCNYFRRFIDDRQYGGVKKGLRQWHDIINSFGLGVRTGIDLPNESQGIIPSPDYYNKLYRGSWNSITIVSLGIGQGEMETTPLQMANLMTCFANRGFYYPPHLIRAIEGTNDTAWLGKYRTKHIAAIQDQDAYDEVIQGMENVVVAGTAANVRIKNIVICGKTGTAQNPHGKEHSWFACYAPRDKPQIAVAVIVENAGFGADFAAPIASLLIEKYINKTISPEHKAMEKHVLEVNLTGRRRELLKEQQIILKRQVTADSLLNNSIDTTH